MDAFTDLHSRLITNYTNGADLFFRIVELNRIKSWINKTSIDIAPSVDIGCGNGFVFHEIFGRKSDFGIDNNEAGDAQISQKTFRTKDLTITDASIAWPKKITQVNLHFSNCVIEHIPNYKGVLKEVLESSSQNAYFIFTVPNDKFEEYMLPKILVNLPLFSNYFRYLGKQRAKKLNHFNQFNKEKWIEVLNKFSYEIVWYEEYHSNASLVYWNFLAVINKFMPKYFLNLFAVKSFLSNLSELYFLKDLESKDGGCSLIVARRIIEC